MLSTVIALVCLTHGPSLKASSDSAVLTSTSYYSLLKDARKEQAASHFKEAADKFERLAASNPASGEAWLQLGNCYYEIKQPAKAIEPYKRALDLGQGAIENTAYNIGCCYALSGDKENAFKWVEKALAMRFEDRSLIQRDTDLTILRDDPRFKKLAGLPPKENASRDEQWRYDIDFLVSEMRRMHYRWSVEGLPKGVEEGAKSLRANVSKLSDDEIMVGMQKLLAKLQDGHSNLRPINAKKPVMKLPIRFYKFEEGLYIINSPEGHEDLKGAQVVTVGGKTVEQVWPGLADLVSRDNDQGIPWIGPMYLSLLAVMKDLGAKVDGDSIKLHVIKVDGTEADATIKAEPFTDTHDVKMDAFKAEGAPLYLKQPQNLYWYEPLPDAKAVYFQYNQVANKDDEPVSAFALKLRKYLAENPVENLIIDVRHNNGGNSYLNRELIRTFVTFEAAKQGRIFLITGRNTFSAAQNFTNDVCRMTNAIVVGEPSSSRPFFIGESAPVVLPYSQLRGTISTRLHTVDARDMRVWIAPDIPVPVTAKDYLANRDATMEAVLEVIKGG